MLSRRTHRAFAFLAVLAVAFLLTFADAGWQRVSRAGAVAEMQGMVARLGLSDLCLFTEARYTRHPSQADLHSAFQDHPMAFEHFPSGSLIAPPKVLTDAYENLDRKAKGAD